jgi:hypothetical protein
MRAIHSAMLPDLLPKLKSPASHAGTFQKTRLFLGSPPIASRGAGRVGLEENSDDLPDLVAKILATRSRCGNAAVSVWVTSPAQRFKRACGGELT